jgi:hypothetical protein
MHWRVWGSKHPKALLLDLEARLKKLEYALTRIDSPDFGICQICDEPILTSDFLLSLRQPFAWIVPMREVSA